MTDLKLFRFLSIVFLLLTFGVQAQMVRYSDEVKVTHIDTLNGFYNGEIKLWNDNGVLLLEGNYKDDQKFGKWIFYDSIGNPKVIREYENSYQFKTIEGKDLIAVSLKRDKNGMVEHPDVESKNIIKVINTYKYIINTGTTPELFEDDRLWLILIQAIKNKADVYKDHNFEEKATEFELNKIINDYTTTIMGFSMKEIYYFDKSIQSFGKRIVGINPLFLQKPDTTLWFFYPEIRDILSLEKLYQNDLIQSFDDLLFFGEFDSIPVGWEGMDYKKYNGATSNSRQDRLEMITDFNLHLLKTEHKIITE